MKKTNIQLTHYDQLCLYYELVKIEENLKIPAQILIEKLGKDQHIFNQRQLNAFGLE